MNYFTYRLMLINDTKYSDISQNKNVKFWIILQHNNVKLWTIYN